MPSAAIATLLAIVSQCWWTHDAQYTLAWGTTMVPNTTPPALVTTLVPNTKLVCVVSLDSHTMLCFPCQWLVSSLKLPLGILSR